MSKKTKPSSLETLRQAVQFPISLRSLAIYCLFPIAYCLLLTSCKTKKDTLNIDYQYEYYPLDTGHYVIYDVDSIFYSYNGAFKRDTVHYQWKFLIADTLYDNENQLNYRLEVYRRPDDNALWNIDRVWYARGTTNTLLVIEDDIKFIKLIFPPEAGKHWDGNKYVPASSTTPYPTPYDIFEDWNYYYANIDTTLTLNGLNFEHAIVVSEADNENLIEKTLRREIYAKNVGMIYQEWESLTKSVSADWNTGIENGFRIRMRVREHN